MNFTDNHLYDKLPWFQRLAINVIRCAPVPRHMAFIMDGNRRYAEKIKIEKQAGIAFGVERFIQVMEWAGLLGIKEITVYALSIENFKRPKTELDFIFHMMKTKLESFLNNLDYYLKYGTRFKFIGNMSLLPDNLQVIITKLELATKDCNVIQINVAVSYTSRDEICSAIKSVVNGVENNEIDVHDIDESLLTRCLYTGESPEVDLLLRTSGENRLSDFLLWQSTSSKLIFIQALWPEITLWEIIYEIVNYQRTTLREQVIRRTNKISSETNEINYFDRFSKMLSILAKLTLQAKQKLKYFLHFDKIRI